MMKFLLFYELYSATDVINFEQRAFKEGGV
jgi:hypothetical protein